jgi:hypothetical protein
MGVEQLAQRHGRHGRGHPSLHPFFSRDRK